EGDRAFCFLSGHGNPRSTRDCGCVSARPAAAPGSSSMVVGRHDSCHQVIVPVALDLEVRRSTLLEGFDEVVVHVCVDTRLVERVERCACRAARYEPGFLVEFRRVSELACGP